VVPPEAPAIAFAASISVFASVASVPFSNGLGYDVIITGVLPYQICDAYRFLETGTVIEQLSKSEVQTVITSILDQYTDFKKLPNADRLTRMVIKSIIDDQLVDPEYGADGNYEEKFEMVNGEHIDIYKPINFSYKYHRWGVKIFTPIISNVDIASKAVKDASEKQAKEELEKGTEATDANTLIDAANAIAGASGGTTNFDQAINYMLNNRGKSNIDYKKYNVDDFAKIAEAISGIVRR
jgi:hypothetical protein